VVFLFRSRERENGYVAMIGCAESFLETSESGPVGLQRKSLLRARGNSSKVSTEPPKLSR